MQKFSFAPFGAPKNVQFFVRRAEKVSTFLSVDPANSKCTTAPGKSSICSRTQVERG